MGSCGVWRRHARQQHFASRCASRTASKFCETGPWPPTAGSSGSSASGGSASSPDSRQTYRQARRLLLRHLLGRRRPWLLRDLPPPPQPLLRGSRKHRGRARGSQHPSCRRSTAGRRTTSSGNSTRRSSGAEQRSSGLCRRRRTRQDDPQRQSSLRQHSGGSRRLHSRWRWLWQSSPKPMRIWCSSVQVQILGLCTCRQILPGIGKFRKQSTMHKVS